MDQSTTLCHINHTKVKKQNHKSPTKHGYVRGTVYLAVMRAVFKIQSPQLLAQSGYSISDVTCRKCKLAKKNLK